MRTIAASTIIVSSIFVGLVSSDASAQIYQEQNGQVVVEIEAQPATGSWQVSQAIA